MTDREQHTASARRARDLSRSMRRDRALIRERDMDREYRREIQALRLDMQDTGRRFV
jgi:hypothetical protein